MENFTPKPQPKQESVPQSGIEKMQTFLAEKLETMSPLFDGLQSMFDNAGEKMSNVTLSPELVSRAKIVLPVFMGLLTVMGNVEDASAQQGWNSQGAAGLQNQQMVNPGSDGQVVQMTPEQWAAEQQRQKQLRDAQTLRTVGGISMMVGAGLQGAGMMTQDAKAQNALLISGAVLNVAGTGMVVGGNVKAEQAGGQTTGRTRGYRPY